VATPPPMIPFPNPTNDIMFARLFGLSNKEKEKFRSDQASQILEKGKESCCYTCKQSLTFNW
jgi:hypothetical protein